MTTTSRRHRLIWLPSSISTTSVSTSTSTTTNSNINAVSCCDYTSLENDNENGELHKYPNRRRWIPLSQSENHRSHYQYRTRKSKSPRRLHNDISARNKKSNNIRNGVDANDSNESEKTTNDSIIPLDVTTTAPVGWLTQHCTDEEKEQQHRLVIKRNDYRCQCIDHVEDNDDEEEEEDEPSYSSSNSYVAKYYCGSSLSVNSSSKGNLNYPKLHLRKHYTTKYPSRKKKSNSAICDQMCLLEKQIRLQHQHYVDYEYRDDGHRDKLALSQSFETEETIQLEEEASETSICTITDDDESFSRLQNATGDATCCSSSSSITIDGTCSASTPNSASVLNFFPNKKQLRWYDEVYPDRSIVTNTYDVHYSDEPSYTCRVVFLLMMDQTSSSELLSMNNYEFLHCEFRQDDRLRVCDALPQITRLVLGPTTNTNDTGAPSSNRNEEKSNGGLTYLEPFRPFTRLYLDGKELINTLALQDYCLEDGQSTLVALREPLLPVNSATSSNHKSSKKEENSCSCSVVASEVDAVKQHRNELLRQASLLLSDKCLRRGIRKARIAGRSLQILYGPIGLREQEEQLSRLAAESEEDEYDDLVDESCNIHSNDTDGVLHIGCSNLLRNDDDFINTINNPSWTAFDHLSRTSFDGDDEEEGGWTNADGVTFDVNFFEGANFFRANNLG